MPPLYRPSAAEGKCPPLVMPRGLEGWVDMGDGWWPKRLACPTDAGLPDVCGLGHGLASANEACFSAQPGSQWPAP
jgi:hypothetical protein